MVKADGYGLGLHVVAPTLWNSGCRRFFVALPHEGIALRGLLPEAEIFVLSGPLSPESIGAFLEADLRPVLNSRSDVALWETHGWADGTPRPCALHVDTGMNRLGLTLEEAEGLARDNELTRALAPVLVMSHLACADDPGDALNLRQLELFQRVRQFFPEIESSLSNSAGIFLGADFACDLVRPGIALYGGMGRMRTVVTAEARVLQVRTALAGETASYGASTLLTRDSVIAVVGVGYADGYHRAASGAGVAARESGSPGAEGFLHGRRVPVLGRITMDLTLFDVTGPGADEVNVGDHVELFGPNLPIEEAAAAAGTVPYELLTSLGRRYARHYVGSEGAVE